MSLVVSATWTLEQALPLVRALQPQTRQFGFHLCLGGGVLNAGASDKDLDLYFLTLDNQQQPADVDKLVAWLEGVFGKSDNLFGDYKGDPTSPYTRKLKFQQAGQRIDAFIVGPRE